ncbi:MAG: response regulator transcription factor [Eubacteriales bacterium]|nr:response regulator transcription factor [Eubacteriales bacterium]
MKETIYDNRILIVDDNFELRAMLRTFLSREGYQNITLAADCKGAMDEMRTAMPDFIILDVNLPDGDGFSLMKKMREDPAFSGVPVLFLSARDKDADRLTGLGLGADDYMVKPFLPKELSLRMGAILKRSYKYAALEKGDAAEGGNRNAAGERGAVNCSTRAIPAGASLTGEKAGERGSGTAAGAGRLPETGYADAGLNRTGMEYGYFTEGSELPGKLSLGARSVDFEAGTVLSERGEERLTVKELKILETLAANRGKIVTFDNLCKAVWNAQYYTYENTVMVHIRRLREKIEDDPSKPRWLVTARGIGYKLNQASEPAEDREKRS